MKTDILTIGTEYLTGMLPETDSSYLAGRLAELDADLAHRIIVGDDPNEVRETLATALETSDMIIVTGGVGSGKDPAFRKIFADCFDKQLSFREPAFEHMKKTAEECQLRVTEEELRALAELPEDAKVLPNYAGPACGFILTDGRKHLIVLPGGSQEIRAVFEDDAVGYIYECTALGEAVLSIDLKQPSRGEALEDRERKIRETLADLFEITNPEVTLLRTENEYQIKIRAVGPTAGDASVMAWIVASDCSKRLGEDVAGEIKTVL